MAKKSRLPVFIFSGIFLGVIIKIFVFDILTVSGSSMSPSLKDGSRVCVNRLAYGIALPFAGKFIVQWATPERGDAVIYLHEDKIVVKRCVLVAGDNLEFCADSDYNLVVGGNKISLTRTQYEKLSSFERVPDGYIFALGDNYSESVDSRTYGFVSVKNITGKIIGR